MRRLLAAVESFLCLLLAQYGHLSEGRCPNHTLNLVAFVPCYDDTSSEWSNSQCDVFVYSAAQLAADHINRDPTILTNVTVEIQALVPAVQAIATLEVLGRSSESPDSAVHGVIGSSNDVLLEITTPLITDRLEVPSVTYGVSGSLISEIRNNLFFRTLPSDLFLNEARITLLGQFEWYKVGILSSSDDQSLQEQESFIEVFTKSVTNKFNGIVTIAYAGSFASDGHLNDSLATIRRRNIKIVIGFFGEHLATNVLCKANQFGLTSPNHVWILPSYFDPNWWKHFDTNCTNEEIRDSLQSVIFIGPVKYPPFLQSYQSFSPLEFQEELVEKAHDLFPSQPLLNLTSLLTHSDATSAYDAVWTIATMWSYIMEASLCGSDTLTAEMEQVLVNISDREYFHLNCMCEGTSYSDTCRSHVMGDRNSQDYYGQVMISQFFGEHECPVGVVWPTGDNVVRLKDVDSHSCLQKLHFGWWIHNFTQSTTDNCTLDFQWKGGRGSPPSAGFSLKSSKVDIGTLTVTGVFTLLTLVVIICVLILNLTWRNNRYIKSGSPRLNIIILVAFVILQPIPVFVDLVISANVYSIDLPLGGNILCWIVEWLATIGLTLLLSTLLLKNYRIYRIFYNKKLRKQAKLSDTVLFLLVLAFLVPDIIVLTVTMIISTYKLQIDVVTESHEMYDYNFINITNCKVQHSILLPYDLVNSTILITLMLYFALHNMQLKSRYREEGRVSSIVVILSIVTYVIFYIIQISLQGDLRLYYIQPIYVIIYTTLVPLIIMAVMFLPKFWFMYKDHKKEIRDKHESIVHAKQMEHYHNLCDEATHLRGELAEIERKIEDLKSHTESSYEKNLLPQPEPARMRKKGPFILRWSAFALPRSLSVPIQEDERHIVEKGEEVGSERKEDVMKFTTAKDAGPRLDSIGEESHHERRTLIRMMSV